MPAKTTRLPSYVSAASNSRIQPKIRAPSSRLKEKLRKGQARKQYPLPTIRRKPECLGNGRRNEKNNRKDHWVKRPQLTNSDSDSDSDDGEDIVVSVYDPEEWKRVFIPAIGVG